MTAAITAEDMIIEEVVLSTPRVIPLTPEDIFDAESLLRADLLANGVFFHTIATTWAPVDHGVMKVVAVGHRLITDRPPKHMSVRLEDMLGRFDYEVAHG